MAANPMRTPRHIITQNENVAARIRIWPRFLMTIPRMVTGMIAPTAVIIVNASATPRESSTIVSVVYKRSPSKRELTNYRDDVGK
jgi:hypothetical protein